LSEHRAVLDVDGVRIMLNTDAHESEIFTDEWRDYLRQAPDHLRIVVTQDRIYLEKAR
jgi:hypothetical protein